MPLSSVGIGNGSPEYAAYTKQAGYFTSASDCGCLTFGGAVIHLVGICSGRDVRDSYGYDSLEKGIGDFGLTVFIRFASTLPRG